MGKILIVDDDQFIIDVIADILKHLGIKNYDFANNGQQAVDKYMEFANSTGYDFILMDMHMPIKNGIAATREIRTYESTVNSSNRVPIVFLTGDKKIHQQAMSAGADEFFTKPISFANLKKICQQYLNDRKHNEPFHMLLRSHCRKRSRTGNHCEGDEKSPEAPRPQGKRRKLAVIRSPC